MSLLFIVFPTLRGELKMNIIKCCSCRYVQSSLNMRSRTQDRLHGTEPQVLRAVADPVEFRKLTFLLQPIMFTDIFHRGFYVFMTVVMHLCPCL